MLSDLPIIELDSIDSTNNYAMQLIDANKAQHGLTVTAQSQVAGKGQRGRSWVDTPGQSLLMSIIIDPKRQIEEQFVFNASVATAIVNVLQKLYTGWRLHVKWPNDIIINDKKAGGILIENVLRGNRWTHSVIGVGLNVKQDSFPDTLPFATSLKMTCVNDINFTKLRDELRESIMLCTTCPQPAEKIMELYNEWLYRRLQKQCFTDPSGKWYATILGAHKDGTVALKKEDGTVGFYHHGQAVWEWE